MANVKQTTSQRDRTLAGQWTKSEKRMAASRSIDAYNKAAVVKIKAFKQNQHLNK